MSGEGCYRLAAAVVQQAVFDAHHGPLRQQARTRDDVLTGGLSHWLDILSNGDNQLYAALSDRALECVGAP